MKSLSSKMKSFDYSTYLSPFTWRYGSLEMRSFFSEENKIRTWREIWVALAQAQKDAGLVSQEELNDLKKYKDNLDIGRILEIEKETKHDVVSALKEFAEKTKIGGGKIHLGATSQDIQDNGESLRNKKALELIEKRIITTLFLFAEKIKEYANFACIGYTHLQPAEPTTVGYRFAFYAQDLLTDLELLHFIKKQIKGKGLKGAVGTSASFKALLKGKKTSSAQLEKTFMDILGLEPVEIASQVYPRKFDFLILTTLSSIASSIAKFAFDLRILQSPGFGEWMEPFGKKQVGSSAMPFKRNPFNSEKICSLARYVNSLPIVAQENSSSSLLERTLDDSANKRITMSEGFLAVDEILITAEKIIEGMLINKEKIKFNLSQYAPFSATEIIILEAAKNGADRQRIHELIRELSQTAWNDVQKGKSNPMETLLIKNDEIKKYLSPIQIRQSMDITKHIGDAPERALRLANKISLIIKK